MSISCLGNKGDIPVAVQVRELCASSGKVETPGGWVLSSHTAEWVLQTLVGPPSLAIPLGLVTRG